MVSTEGGGGARLDKSYVISLESCNPDLTKEGHNARLSAGCARQCQFNEGYTDARFGPINGNRILISVKGNLLTPTAE